MQKLDVVDNWSKNTTKEWMMVFTVIRLSEDLNAVVFSISADDVSIGQNCYSL